MSTEAEKILVKVPHDWDSIDESSIFKKLSKNRAPLFKYMQEISEEHYWHWEKARFVTPPKGLTATEAWYITREIRKLSSAETHVKAENGENFTLLRPSYADRLLRDIDMHAGGDFIIDQISNNETSKGERQKYLTRGIIEEAIASAQLEGASTTRKYARKMIAENKRPRNISDWMILNNHRTLQAVEDIYKNQELSMQMLLELQLSLTENTHKSNEIGRLREDSDEIVVMYRDKIAHVPPKHAFVKQELERLIEYANDTEHWQHPVIKAIIIHFWIGYLHPFVDGNGRLARTLFYWYMLKNKYWGVSYLPISTIIKRAPKKYTYAYIYTEQDNLDLTYFFDYNIWKLKKSIDEFTDYIERAQKENKEIERSLDGVMPIANDRQKQLVHYLLSDTDHFVTITSHMTLSAVSRGTARSDILALEKHGLVQAKKVGTNIRYSATEKLRLLV
ncbi:MAG TPA: Fic family protein [Candidatus Saccharimonadia bacterium]|nr:Fic family protein [Candidatus Saccharimonadia bacterium]